MSWMGKILGGGLGFAMGGPLGAMLGAMIGHHALDSGNTLSFQEQRHSIFFLATFSMLGKLSKADGVVSGEEIEVIEQLMRDSLRLDPEARSFAVDIFNRAKDSEDSFEDYARQFHAEFSNQPQALSSLVDLLLRLAHADGVFHPAEERMIDKAVSIFGIQHDYARLQARYSDANDLGKCYEILGAKSHETLSEIKRRYRRLAMDYHPDRMQAGGVSPELIVASEDRFKEIQHAFDIVEKHLKNS